MGEFYSSEQRASKLRRHTPQSSWRTAILSLLSLLSLTLFGCRLEHPTPGKGITLDVAVFQGAFGIDRHKSVARAYEKLHTEIKINLLGDSPEHEQIKPRTLRPDPPD